MSYQIVVAGTEESGKGAVAASMVDLLRARGLKPVLVVDADPAAKLGEHLGIPAGERVIDVLEEVVRTEGEAKERVLDRRLQQECIGEGKECDLLTMGRPAGMEAHCYLNNVFRDALASLKGNYRAVVLDCESELQHLSGMNRADTDCLFVVSEPTEEGACAAARISERSRELPVLVRRRVLIWNGEPEAGAARLIPEGAFEGVLIIPPGTDPARIVGRILES